jgi:hypothetical protein
VTALHCHANCSRTLRQLPVQQHLNQELLTDYTTSCALPTAHSSNSLHSLLCQILHSLVYTVSTCQRINFNTVVAHHLLQFKLSRVQRSVPRVSGRCVSLLQSSTTLLSSSSPPKLAGRVCSLLPASSSTRSAPNCPMRSGRRVNLLRSRFRWVSARSSHRLSGSALSSLAGKASVCT